MTHYIGLREQQVRDWFTTSARPYITETELRELWSAWGISYRSLKDIASQNGVGPKPGRRGKTPHFVLIEYEPEVRRAAVEPELTSSEKFVLNAFDKTGATPLVLLAVQAKLGISREIALRHVNRLLKKGFLRKAVDKFGNVLYYVLPSVNESLPPKWQPSNASSQQYGGESSLLGTDIPSALTRSAQSFSDVDSALADNYN